jgi:hypothetical protein
MTRGWRYEGLGLWRAASSTMSAGVEDNPRDERRIDSGRISAARVALTALTSAPRNQRAGGGKGNRTRHARSLRTPRSVSEYRHDGRIVAESPTWLELPRSVR